MCLASLPSDRTLPFEVERTKKAANPTRKNNSYLLGEKSWQREFCCPSASCLLRLLALRPCPSSFACTTMQQNLLRLRNKAPRKRKASQPEADLAEDGSEPCSIPFVVGSDCCQVLDVASTLAHAGATGQNFVMVPLFHERLRRSDVQRGNGLITRSEMELPHEDWVGHVVGKFSRWIDMDSSSSLVRQRAEVAFMDEYAYAAHLGLQAIVFAPHGCLGANSLRNLKLALTRFSATSPQIWLSLAFSEHGSPWPEWDKARQSLSHDRRLGVVLDLTATSLPNLDSTPTISAWAAEPLKAIVIPTSLFRQNRTGSALVVGNKSDRSLLQWFTHRGVHVALRGAATQQSDVKEMIRALSSMHAKSLPLSSPQALQREFNSKYRDVLQSPLDPLCVNLDSETYQVMEEDPVKYELYAEALHAAMRDIRTQADSSATTSSVLRVLVVGPGRGPLIAATLQRFRALRKQLQLPSSQWKLQVVAVEKNRNAVITLRNRFADFLAKGVVQIIAGDMREVLARRGTSREGDGALHEKVDIIVSELLGSWGDNEASPECLAAVQPWLQPHGVMIPQQYCSFLAPIAASKLWMDAREMFWGARGSAAGKEGLDCPYVVQMESFAPIASPQPVFQVRLVRQFTSLFFLLHALYL